jgi:triosephosphate isomerase
MKYIYLNLKRFDIPAELGGVNRLAPPAGWGPFIVKNIESGLEEFKGKLGCAVFFPEAHVSGAAEAKEQDLGIGCQSVFWDDTGGANFGAFTSSRTANAMKALGCTDTIIGHCEERKALESIIRAGDGKNLSAVNGILNREIQCAVRAGLRVLYCVGEKSEEQPQWESVLGAQLDSGLKDTDRKNIVIAYEPVWAIGPGKTPPDGEYIKKIATFIKSETGGLPVVYGGGLKKENAEAIGAIPEIDGGLIALTRFSGEIGFYPDEYIEIIRTYLAGSEGGK